MTTPTKEIEYEKTEDGFDVLDRAEVYASRPYPGDSYTQFRVPLTHQPVRIEVKYEGETGVGIRTAWSITNDRNVLMNGRPTSVPDETTKRDYPLLTPTHSWWCKDAGAVNVRYIGVETDLPPGLLPAPVGKGYIDQYCKMTVLLIGQRRS